MSYTSALFNEAHEARQGVIVLASDWCAVPEVSREQSSRPSVRHLVYRHPRADWLRGGLKFHKERGSRC